MRAFTVDARSLESAQALYTALASFHPEISGDDDEGYRVTIELGSSDREVIAVLDALQRYASERAGEPTRVELDGRRYTLHPEQTLEEPAPPDEPPAPADGPER
jgi:hypothetical protein